MTGQGQEEQQSEIGTIRSLYKKLQEYSPMILLVGILAFGANQLGWIHFGNPPSPQPIPNPNPAPVVPYAPSELASHSLASEDRQWAGEYYQALADVLQKDSLLAKPFIHSAVQLENVGKIVPIIKDGQSLSQKYPTVTQQVDVLAERDMDIGSGQLDRAKKQKAVLFFKRLAATFKGGGK